MATMDPEEIVDVPDEEVVLVVLDGTVILMDDVEKRDPVIERRVPAAGSCSHPALRARRTGRC